MLKQQLIANWKFVKVFDKICIRIKFNGTKYFSFCVLRLTLFAWWLYEAWAILSETELVSLQPLGADHATLPYMKAMHVPFHLVYGSLISFKGFQSDRPKSRGMSVDPR